MHIGHHQRVFRFAVFRSGAAFLRAAHVHDGRRKPCPGRLQRCPPTQSNQARRGPRLCPLPHKQCCATAPQRVSPSSASPPNANRSDFKAPSSRCENRPQENKTSGWFARQEGAPRRHGHSRPREASELRPMRRLVGATAHCTNARLTPCQPSGCYRYTGCRHACG